MSRGPVIDLSCVDMGRLIGRGGAGRVYEVSAQRLEDTRGPLVAKLYNKVPDPDQAAGLLHQVAFAEGLDVRGQGSLLEVTAWPIAVLSERGALVGLLMPDMRPRFAFPARLPSGRSESAMTALEHLIAPSAYLQRTFGVTPSADVRLQALGSLAAALAVLHGLEVWVVDFSPRNVLLRLDGQGAVFLDCDEMTVSGVRAFPSTETPDWQAPGEEDPDSEGADRYKLALAVLRVMLQDFTAWRMPTDAPGLLRRALPPELVSMLSAGLGPVPDARPSASAWAAALDRAVPPSRMPFSSGWPEAVAPRKPGRPSPEGVPGEPQDAPAQTRQAPESVVGRDRASTASRARATELQPSMVALLASLDRHGTPQDFSQASLDRFVQLQDEYAAAVGAEAVRRARHNRGDYVSAADIELAAAALVSNTHGPPWQEAIGGLLGGSGWGTFIQFLLSKDPSPLALIWVGVCQVGGGDRAVVG